MPTFEEVQSFIESNKDDEKVKGYIGGFITPDRVTAFLESEDGKKILQPRLDSHFTKGLETWKTNNLTKMVEDELTKRNPAQTPEQKELAKIKSDHAELQTKIKRGEMKDSLIKRAEKDLFPISLIDFAIGDDENSTTAKYETLKSIFNSAVDAKINEAFAKNGRTPPPKEGGKGPTGMNAVIRKAAGY